MPGNLSSDSLIAAVRRRIAAHRPVALESGPVPAAVLVPLFLKNSALHLLLTKRAADLKHHAGEISFPGGVCDLGEHPRDAALRETWEEIGLPADRVDLFGQLDDVYSIHHYRVTPFIGIISGNISLSLNKSEIDSIIEVPVSHLLDPSCRRIEEWGWQGRNYPVYFYRYQDEDIWGMTAEIVRNLLDVAFREGG